MEQIPTLIDLLELWAAENVSDRYTTRRRFMYGDPNSPTIVFYDKNPQPRNDLWPRDPMLTWILSVADDLIWSPFESINLHYADPEFFDKLVTILDSTSARRKELNSATSGTI